MSLEKGAYNFSQIEKNWQKFWEDNRIFKADDCDTTRPKYYVLDMFPYPSGQGLHVGHPEGYTASDIVARYKRMKGFNVLHPMGWDAFGLPAEQYAVKTGTAPAITTQQNIDNIRRQIKSLGFSYDWDRQVDTTDPNYYKWTQWIFLKFFNSYFDDAEQKAKPIDQLSIPEGLSEEQTRQYIDDHRLAYEAEVAVNWCPELGTVLANEEVIGGVSERGGHPVVRKPMRQWMLRITKYAERLLSDLDQVDWAESIKKLQTDWIGKSIGAEVDFKVVGFDETIRVFTTRPDTLFGATYMVMSPEHPLVDKITTADRKQAVEDYKKKAQSKSDLDRTDLAKDKTGEPLGAYAVNPVNNENIPIWISDYVLISYGTGAIMSVPAHDDRDFEFAMKFGLPILPVIDNPDRVTKSFAMAGTMKEGFADVLRSNDIPFQEDNGSLYVTMSEEKVGSYIELVQQFLLPGSWNEVLGTVWSFIFDDGLQQWNSLESEKNILARCKTVAPNVGDKRTLMEMLWGCEFYRDVLYHDKCGTMINSKEFTNTPGDVATEKITTWLEEKGLGEKAINYKLRDWLFSRQRYWGEPFPLLHTEGGIVGVSEDDLPLELPHVESYKPAGTGEPPLANATDWLNVTLPDDTKAVRETNTMPQWAGSCWYYLRYLDNKNFDCAWDAEKEKYWMPVDLYIGGAEHAVLHLLYSRFWHKFLYDLGYVTCVEPFKKLINQGMILGEDGQKMSKSRGNVVNPDNVITGYGADSMRLYEMFMGPLEASKPWNMHGVEGVHRFLQKVWKMIIDPETGELAKEVQSAEPDAETEKILHQTIKKVGDDIEKFAFNTAISQMMIFTNHMAKQPVRPKAVLEKFVLVLAPLAPHICEQLWQTLGHADSLAYEPWPRYNAELVKEKQIELAIQVNGKIRGKITIDADAAENEIKQLALEQEKVKADLVGKQVRKVIVIKSRLVNIVAG